MQVLGTKKPAFAGSFVLTWCPGEDWHRPSQRILKWLILRGDLTEMGPSWTGPRHTKAAQKIVLRVPRTQAPLAARAIGQHRDAAGGGVDLAIAEVSRRTPGAHLRVKQFRGVSKS